MANPEDPNTPPTPPEGGGSQMPLGGDGKQNLIPINIEDEMRRSYLDYAMSVIIGRALPDVRDGLKPVHRRILYAMSEMGLAFNRPYRKCAGIVGEVLGNYHPHGDAPVYDALVRMAQDFSLRYPLVDGQGNFGSVDGDPPAAYRYTEARLSRIDTALLEDLDKETVDFRPNFDERKVEPEVLPTRVPNLLINGSSGIAVGMATNIPPHNLTEIINATILLVQKPDTHLSEIVNLVQGPDFPTGGFILGRQGILDYFTKGRGTLKLRAKAATESHGQGSRSHHRHRDSLPGEQSAADRDRRRAGERQEDRGHFRNPRRERPRRHAHRLRAEARRAGRGDPQQSVQAHPASDQLRRDHAVHRERAAARAGAAGRSDALHRSPHRRGAPPHRLLAAQGARARAHPARLQEGARKSGRRDQADPRIEDSQGSARRT